MKKFRRVIVRDVLCKYKLLAGRKNDAPMKIRRYRRSNMITPILTTETELRRLIIASGAKINSNLAITKRVFKVNVAK